MSKLNNNTNLEDGFYVGKIFKVKERKYDVKLTFQIKNGKDYFYPIAILDKNMMSQLAIDIIQTSLFSYKSADSYFMNCIGNQMTILVKKFDYLKVVDAYPEDMYRICKENEEGFLKILSKNIEDNLENISSGRCASFIGFFDEDVEEFGEPLCHEETYDVKFRNQVMVCKEKGFQYKIPDAYYASQSTPFRDEDFR